MKLIKYLSLLLILFSSINAKAESRKNQLDRLFNELKTDNPALTYETEQKIWKIWSTHPTNQNLTEKLTEGSKLVRNKKLLKAIKIYNPK